jgi:thiol-disulfide isomerase/thioredoxin
MKLPKIILALVISLLSMLAVNGCTKETKKHIKTIFDQGPVIVAGKLENAVNKRVELTIIEPTGRVEYTTKTDEKGCFQFNVEVLSAHDNYLHAGQLTTIYLEPNDSIFITGDARNFKETIAFSGDNTNINNCIRDFYYELSKRLTAEEYFYKYTKKTDNPVSPTEYKEIIFSFFNKMEVIIDSIAQINKADTKTIAWMKAYNKYRKAEEILEYVDDFDGEFPEGFCYFDNEEYLKRDEMDFNCSQYFEDFLQSYYLGFKLSKINGFSKAINGLQDQTYEGLENGFNFINENITDTLYKNIFLTMICNGLIESDYELVDSIYPKYSQLVKDITCQNFIQRRISNEKAKPSLVNTISELASKQYIGEIFKDIENKCKDKVIYIDVWGTWCGGCVNALQYTAKLHNKLPSKDFEFVYLCLMSDDDDWAKIRKKYKLKGLHYLLDKKQYVEMGDLLNIYGIPRYIIIDKEGKIVDANAKPPYSSVVQKELLTIAK